MKTKLLGIMAIAIIAITIIGCKQDDPTPQPGLPDGTYKTVSGTVKVTINNESLLSAEKKSILKELLTELLADKNVTGNLTINVIADGTNTFVSAGSRTLSVGASWIVDKNKVQIGSAINALLDTWIA
jgi:hypothetical protein